MQAQLKSPTIYVVSGLPRSGTSLMMQMLEAGGMLLFTDQKRTPDVNNPNGYFEHEAVKRITRDTSWMIDARDKVVKIIADLLVFLPLEFEYNIIFMLRDLDEIIDSQNKMLLLSGKTLGRLKRNQLKEAFQQTIDRVRIWAGTRNNIRIFYQKYEDLIHAPHQNVKRIADFMDRTIDQSAAAGVIDKNLYRIRSKSG